MTYRIEVQVVDDDGNHFEINGVALEHGELTVEISSKDHRIGQNLRLGAKAALKEAAATVASLPAGTSLREAANILNVAADDLR